MHVEPSAAPSTGGSALSTLGSNAFDIRLSEHLHHGKFILFPKNVFETYIQHKFMVSNITSQGMAISKILGILSYKDLMTMWFI